MSMLFQPVWQCKKIVTTIGEELAKQCKMEVFEFDFTLPANRSKEIHFDALSHAERDICALGRKALIVAGQSMIR